MPAVNKSWKVAYLVGFLLIAALSSVMTFKFTLSAIFAFVSMGIFSFAAKEDLVSQKVDWRVLVLGAASGLGMYFQTQGYNVIGILLSIVGAAIIPFVLVALSKEQWMGWGDVIMAAWVGLVCGFPRALLAIFFAFLGGAVFGIITLAKGERRRTLAFGPFLILGCALALVFGGKIITWYLGII